MFLCNLVVSDVTAATVSQVSIESVTNNFFNVQFLKFGVNAIGLKTPHLYRTKWCAINKNVEQMLNVIESLFWTDECSPLTAFIMKDFFWQIFKNMLM